MSRIEKCRESHSEILLEYLSKEAVRNTFLIGDIINYGFENEIQQVWADFEGEACEAVYLWFCNNLLIYSHKEKLNKDSLEEIVTMKKPDQIMAKRVHLEQIQPILEEYVIKSKSLLAYNKKDIAVSIKDEKWDYRCATISEVDIVYDFLQSGELAPLYRSREMIRNRIETGDGIHLLVEKDNQVIGHINSAASTPYSTMMGGLYVEPRYRGLGLGSFLAKSLCEEIIKENRVPCLITAQVPEHNLLYKVGFEEVEAFTTLEPR